MNAKKDVVCPFLGTNNETWYNGMFISSKAFSLLGEIRPSENRYDYQRLFSNVSSLSFKGIIKENIDAVTLNTYMMTTDLTFSGRRPDFSQELIWTPKRKQ